MDKKSKLIQNILSSINEEDITASIILAELKWHYAHEKEDEELKKALYKVIEYFSVPGEWNG